MLSPATFLGIAKAVPPAAQPAVVRPPPAGNAGNESAAKPRVQSARVLSTPPLNITPPPPTSAKPPASITPAPQPPPRNLPRGSLLDISV
jgi:hemolysin activation/secretion protein